MPTPVRHTKNTRELLRAHDLKATPQRVLIYDKMCEMVHACADSIFREVCDGPLPLSVATVYNVLETFEEKGLVKRRPTSSKKVFYDINTFPHCHLYSRDEEVLTDLFDYELQSVVTDYLKTRKLKNFTWTDVDIQINGNSRKNNRKIIKK